MPGFVIPVGGGKAHFWEIPPGATEIGREDSAGLCLPNVSVSRRHATVTLTRQAVSEEDDQDADEVNTVVVTVEDLDSRNGIVVNDEKVDKKALKTGDIVRVGKFRLVMLDDNENFYKGRAVKYMPAWKGLDNLALGTTYDMAPEDVERLMRRQHVMDQGRLVLATNQKRYWFPEEGTLTFGSKGMIHIDGLLARGVVAEVKWDGDAHVITRQGMLSKLKVNGESVSDHKLKSGDNLEICGTRFVYAIP